MSRTPGSRARYKHKRATARLDSGKRTQAVAALVTPPVSDVNAKVKRQPKEKAKAKVAA